MALTFLLWSKDDTAAHWSMGSEEPATIICQRIAERVALGGLILLMFRPSICLEQSEHSISTRTGDIH